MKMIINSPKHGTHTVYFDDEDIDKIKQYKWSIWKSQTGKYYALHSWKRNGEEVSIKMHRLIMGIEKTSLPLVDHFDGDTLNNKKSNLRIASHSQNSMNRDKTIKNKSGFKGVYFDNDKQRFRVVLTSGGKKYYGGYFVSVLDAARKYNELAILYHGEFAYTNKKYKYKCIGCDNENIYTQGLGHRKRYNSTSFRGVAEINDSKQNKYRAYINVDGKRINLGCYKDAISAAMAYDDAAKKYHKECATLNF